MTDMVKRCHHLCRDRKGGYRCKSTHICYRSVCLKDMFITVLHTPGHIEVEQNN